MSDVYFPAGDVHVADDGRGIAVELTGPGWRARAHVGYRPEGTLSLFRPSEGAPMRLRIVIEGDALPVIPGTDEYLKVDHA